MQAIVNFSVLLLTFCVLHATCRTCNYKCPDKDNLKVVTILNTNLSCPGTTICNQYGNDCRPCVEPSDKCSGIFECSDPDKNKVTIDKNVYTCPKHYSCNSELVEDCSPCVRTQCEDFKYTCTDDPTKVLNPDNIESTCGKGTVCNKDAVAPCTPCIGEELSARSFIHLLKVYGQISQRK